MKTWKSCIASLPAVRGAWLTAAALRAALGQTQAMSGEATGEGAWSVERQDGRGLWASTKGDGGRWASSAAKKARARGSSCLWDASCAQGEQHPVLVNTDRAASHHVLQCIGAVPGLGSALAFADFDRVDFSLRGASVVGIAIPEPTDAIGVAHFKLDGAGATIDSMRARILAQARAE